MILQELYKEVGGDYDMVMARLAKEERVIKYLLKFSEAGAFNDYEKAAEANDYEECFRTLHSLKGMCLNLGLKKLEKSSTDLCEVYRHGEPTVDITELYNTTKNDYDNAIKAIRSMLNP